MIKVDKEKCIGCGACVAIAPDTFKMGSESKPEAFSQNGDKDKAKQAQSNCPVQAISGA